VNRAVFTLALFLTAVSAFAQNQRTFVSGQGLDTNPCSVTSPCRSIATALGVTNPAGEVVILDSAGYGQSVTINKSANIVVPAGIFAAMTPVSPNGTRITVLALSTDVIRVDGLQILGTGAANGQTGVNIGTCLRTHLTNMQIKSVANGVKVSADVRVVLNGVDISEFSNGIWMAGTNVDPTTTTLRVFGAGCSLIGGAVGIRGDTGNIQMGTDLSYGIDGNRMAFISTNSVVLTTHVGTCSQIPGAFFSAPSSDARTANGTCTGY